VLYIQQTTAVWVLRADYRPWPAANLFTNFTKPHTLVEKIELLPASNGEEPMESCPNCINGWNVDHTGFFGGSRKCITCGGSGKIVGNTAHYKKG